MDSDSDSEEQQRDEKFTGRGAAGRVLLIDARDTNNLGTPLQALTAAVGSFRDELRAGSSTSLLTSVCLYNTTKGVVELCSLQSPSLTAYRALADAELTPHGQAADCELADALWHCGRVFASCPRRLGERTVILMGRLDAPPPRNQQRPALKRAVDLGNLGIELRLVDIATSKYKTDPFYLELLQASSNNRPDWGSALSDPTWTTADIAKRLQRRSHRLAASARIRLQIGEGLTFAVGIYHLTSKRGPPKKVTLSRDRNELVSSNITNVRVTSEPMSIDEPGPSTSDAPNNGSREIPLLKSELIFYQVFGGERIEFTGEELYKIKAALGPPQIRLLGFKPKDILCKEKWFLKSCELLFPDESAIEGSTRAFRALHSACKTRDVVAVCMLRARVSSHPSLVALSPCERPFDQDIDIGFDIIHIPYLENLKDIPEQENVPKSTDLITEIGQMKSIVKQLKFNYNAAANMNPNLQCLYRAIEALALEEETVEPFQDTTKRSQDAFNAINSELFEATFGPFGASGGAKRSGWGGEPAPKRHTTDRDANIDEDYLQFRLQNQQIHKYNVNDLKAILRWKNPPDLKALTGVKKDELIDLVYKYCA